MKNAYLLLLPFLGLTLNLNAQSERMVLIEEATNASCGPCASQNPAFDNLLNQNREILTAIKYHWYFPGTDPMNAQNPVENNARVAYYGINGVPTATIDGDIPDGPTFGYPGGPHGYTQELIDEYAAVPSPFNLFLSHRITEDQDSIYIDMMIEATAEAGGDLRAHMVVVEKHINFASPPGSNGEKNFLDVMKKMVPDHNGTPLPAFQPGDYMILQGAWKMANIYNISEVGVVGFIQGNSSKEVHQAANSTSGPLTPLYNNEMTVAGVMNVSATNCLSSFSPTVILRNQGADVLTSATIHYRVNNEDTHSYEWTGNLNFMETTEVSLPELGFELLEENTFFAYTVDPNGIPDDYPRNDTLERPFDRAMITPLTVKLMLRTDNNPQEITWEVLNSTGEVQYSGGPYANPNQMYQETFLLGDMECYLFKIYDSGNDGLVLPGFYTLYYGSGVTIKNGTDFGALDSVYFEVNTQVGIIDEMPALNVGIYPNPASDKANFQLILDKSSEVFINIYSMTGQLVLNTKEGYLSAGEHQITIDTSSLTPGLYLYRVLFDGYAISGKLTIR